MDAAGVYFNGGGPADSFNVVFYTDTGGFPGLATRSAMSYTTSGGDCVSAQCDFTINPEPEVDLSEGTYWVSVQANLDFAAGGEWGWEGRIVQANNEAAWRNPGDGFGTGCIDRGPQDHLHPGRRRARTRCSASARGLRLRLRLRHLRHLRRRSHHRSAWCRTCCT